MVAVSDDVTLEIEIETLFEQSIQRQNKLNGEEREPGFHFSGLSYDCLRNIQYAVMASQSGPVGNEPEGEDEEIDMEGLYRMWIGTQLHLTPVTRKHEWKLMRVVDVDGRPVPVHGSIDEILERPDGTAVIIDKKFTATVPRTPNPHYMKQVEYYCGVYAEQTGAKVEKGALLYFSPFVGGSYHEKGKERMKVFTFAVDTKAAVKELDDKVRTVQQAINTGKVVDRTTGWLCRYCKWKQPCEVLSGPVDGQMKLDGSAKA